MHKQFNRSILAAMALAIGTAGFTAGSVAQAGDACAGQTWPNLSDACIEQRAKKLSETMTVKEKPKSKSRQAKIKLN